MIPMTLPTASGANPRRFRLLMLAILVLGAAHIVERAAYWSNNWDAYASSDSASGPVTITIGNTGFVLPVDYIARPKQRSRIFGGETNMRSLKLSMTWPGLAPVTGSPGAGRFGATGRTLVVDLEHNPGRESMRARLDPFYRRLARGGEMNGPDGLKILTLSSRGAAKRDLIVYDPARPNGFIARCVISKSRHEAMCYRAIVMTSGLELRYRFDEDLLANWRQIDDAIVHKVRAFQQS